MSTLPNLTVEQGFEAMRVFLEAYWIEGGRKDQELMLLWTALGCDVPQLDPGHWHSWIAAVRKVTGTELPEI